MNNIEIYQRRSIMSRAASPYATPPCCSAFEGRAPAIESAKNVNLALMVRLSVQRGLNKINKNMTASLPSLPISMCSNILRLHL